MNILQTIVAAKQTEVQIRSQANPIRQLEKSAHFGRDTFSLKGHITKPGLSGIIAEYKRKSPSKGIINAAVGIETVTTGYAVACASAISVLTDTDFFGGTNHDLSLARSLNNIPILRKDFTISEYQVIEAKSIGADAILLIAAILNPSEISNLAKLAHSLNMEVLLEVHSLPELQHSPLHQVDVIGVNNRDLKTFTLSLNTSIDLAQSIPATMIKVSESGIKTAADAAMLHKHGYHGFLIGEQFMQSPKPGQACADFINELSILKHSF